jgi:adenosine deaminase
MRDLRALPKVELHIHLEGAMRIATVLELADRNGVPAPTGLGPDGWRFDGFLDFIDQYIALCDLLTELDDFRRLGEEVSADLAANGVRYAEAVFTPSAHAAAFGDDWTSPLEALLDGLAAGARAHGTLVRVTPDVVRDLGVPAAERTLDVALAHMDAGVVGLNCAGSERADIAPFAPVFRAAKQAGLRSVPHAGEWAGPDNVWQTLEYFLPDRIGHGVRSIDDPRLVEHLAAAAIPLEISPISNVATGAYPSLEHHPFMRLREAGVVVTLNSDDPPMFGAWLADVYEAARADWSLHDEALAEIARTGVRASFADDDVKAAIVSAIDAWLASP